MNYLFFIVILLVLDITTLNTKINTIHLSQIHSAMIKVESNFNHKAVSRKGAIGLMQVRPSVWLKELKKQKIINNRKCLFNPKKNVEAGKYILAKYINETGSLEKALHKYSGGAKNYYWKVMSNVKEVE